MLVPSGDQVKHPDALLWSFAATSFRRSGLLMQNFPSFDTRRWPLTSAKYSGCLSNSAWFARMMPP